MGENDPLGVCRLVYKDFALDVLASCVVHAQSRGAGDNGTLGVCRLVKIFPCPLQGAGNHMVKGRVHAQMSVYLNAPATSPVTPQMTVYLDVAATSPVTP